MYLYMGPTASEVFNLPPFDPTILKNVDFLILGFQLNSLSNFKENFQTFSRKIAESLNLNNVIFLPNIPQVFLLVHSRFFTKF